MTPHETLTPEKTKRAPHAHLILAVLFAVSILNFVDRQILGTMFGSGNARRDIPALMELYTQGQLMLDEMVTTTYTLDEINEGFEALRAAENIRGVILFD